MINPNEYDDEAFTDASNRFQSQDGIERLWDAGAEIKDLEAEIANMLDGILGGSFQVSIMDRG